MSKKKSSKARHGPSKPGRKSYGTPRRTTFDDASRRSQPEAKSHFSLQDEARFTGGRQSFWSIDTKLRSRGVQFVSAGLHSTMEEDDVEASSPGLEEHSTSNVANEHSVTEDSATANPNGSATLSKPSKTALIATTDGEISDARLLNSHPTSRNASPSIHGQEPDLFFVDTVGDRRSIPTIRRPSVRSPSPTRSDSSDEVVFRGRSGQVRNVDDPVTKSNHHLVESSTTGQLIPDENTWDDTSVEWVHRSKPGIGWSVPKEAKKRGQQPLPLTFRIPKNQQPEILEEVSAVDDYLQNVQEHDPDFLRYASFAQRNIDADLEDGGQVHQKFQSLTVSSSKEKSRQTSAEQSKNEDSSESNGEEWENDPDDEVDLDSEEPSDSQAESNDFDDDSNDDDEDKQSIREHAVDDETLAILLSKQEELGLGSEELFLFNDGVDASVRRAAMRYEKDKPKKSRRNKDSFPSATLLADVLDQDPYGGFDIMDFERPSLRKKKGKGKSNGPDLPFDLSDEDLQQAIQNSWENDRHKKKTRKLEREELRMQGLLGGNDVTSKYGEGMTIWQIGKEFESFLGSDEAEEKAFPPMDKRRRKMIHEIAMEFNLKTKSIGSGDKRFTKLIKTKTTTRYQENRFVARARKINMGFFPRQDLPGKGRHGLRASARNGNSHAVRYRDGDVVGGAAPEIGAENKGRAMLEKMGWTSGMALGTHDNKGILEPIAHIIKNTKSGLG